MCIRDSVEAGRRGDLLGVPLICSRQALLQGRTGNKYGEWFGDDFEKMDVAATFNLVYNACRMVETGMGYALTIDGLADTGEDLSLIHISFNSEKALPNSLAVMKYSKRSVNRGSSGLRLASGETSMG